MTGMLKRSLLLTLVVVFFVGVVGCGLFKKDEKTDEVPAPAPREKVWGDDTTDNIMQGATAEPETRETAPE